MRLHGGIHLRGGGAVTGRFFRLAQVRFNACHFFSRQVKQAGDKDGFGYLAIHIGRRLEGFARLGGEGVQVQAVVPVSATNQRQVVRAEAVQRVLQAALEVFVQRRGL